MIRNRFADLLRPKVWKETSYLLLDIFVGAAYFSVIVTMLSLSLGLLVVVVGVALFAGTVAFGRVVISAEAARAKALLDYDLPRFPTAHDGSGAWAKLKAAMADEAGWRGLIYGCGLLFWGCVSSVAALTLWAVALGGTSFPLWAWSVSDGPFSGGYRLTGVGLATYNAATFGVGLVTLYFTPSLIGLLATVDKAVLRMLLAPDQQAVLARRVEQLTESRDASVESSASELRRIERDLHDGAQQRLVGLAMDLGLAKERLARGEDPVRAAELVARAHEEAKLAISELRDLVRGIQPSILSEQGLDPALSALAARCPVPVEVDVQLASRPVASVESAAYFVVAEALANIAKHAEATRAWVRVLGTAQLLSVEVGDDGRGGAVSHAGGGLAGLDDRVRAVEGCLRVSSPPGGPTVLLAELPCAS